MTAPGTPAPSRLRIADALAIAITSLWTRRLRATLSGAGVAIGITGLDGQPLVWLGDEWFAVVGILRPVLLAPEIDSTALIGFTAAEQVLGIEPNALRPTAVYVRTQPEAIDEVRQLLGRAANPESPEAVRTSRPSDALAARQAAITAFTALLLGLGGVALFVGGVGVANVMVIAVLERRTEIGLRRPELGQRCRVGQGSLVQAGTPPTAESPPSGTPRRPLPRSTTEPSTAARAWPERLAPLSLPGSASGSAGSVVPPGAVLVLVTKGEVVGVAVALVLVMLPSPGATTTGASSPSARKANAAGTVSTTSPLRRRLMSTTPGSLRNGVRTRIHVPLWKSTVAGWLANHTLTGDGNVPTMLT
jgi:hypothetical protein